MVRIANLFAAFLVAIVVHGAAALADEAAMRMEVERAAKLLDEAYVDQDAALIETMVTSDHRSVTTYYGKPFTVAEQMKTLDQYKARLFDVTDEHVVLLGNDAALITFEKSYDGTFAGKTLPKRVFVSALWSKEDGKWLQAFYQETAIGGGGAQ